MAANDWSKLPQEIKDQSYTDLFQAKQYIIVEQEARAIVPISFKKSRLCRKQPPAYAGMMRASKEISTEMQEILYRKCIFRAYLCWHPLPCMPFSGPQDFSRIQKVEILIDLPSQARAYDTIVRKPSHDPRQLEDYYRKWFKAIGASGAYRNFCRIRITNIVLSDFSRTTVYKEFVCGFKHYTSFGKFIVGFGRAAESPYESQSGGISPPRAPVYAGRDFEELKDAVRRELERSLGSCFFYDRDHIRCLEFRPHSSESIPAGCAPYMTKDRLTTAWMLEGAGIVSK